MVLVVCSLLEILSCALAMWEARAVVMLRERACVAHSFGLWESGFAFAALAALGMRPVGAAFNWVRNWRAWLGGALRRKTTGELRGRSVAEEKGVGCLAWTSQVVNCEGKEEDFCIKDCLHKISTCDSSLRVVALCARELVDFTVKVGPVQG